MRLSRLSSRPEGTPASGWDVTREPPDVLAEIDAKVEQVLDELGRAVPPGTMGVVAVSGPTVFAGYDGDAGATAAAAGANMLQARSNTARAGAALRWSPP